MRAKNSRKTAENVISVRDAGVLSDIYEYIDDASEEGKFEVMYYDKIYDNVLIELKAEGYEVTEDSMSRDGEINYKIKW